MERRDCGPRGVLRDSRIALRWNTVDSYNPTVSDSSLCQDRFRHSPLRNQRKPIPATVPSSFIHNLRTSCSHSPPKRCPEASLRLIPTSALEGRTCSKPREDSQKWLRGKDVSGESG
ncbi:hypothetical protein ABVT39_014446 [Epinephelus coioides]